MLVRGSSIIYVVAYTYTRVRMWIDADGDIKLHSCISADLQTWGCT